MVVEIRADGGEDLLRRRVAASAPNRTILRLT